MIKYIWLLLFVLGCAATPPKTPQPDVPVIIEGKPVWIMLCNMQPNSVYRAVWCDSTEAEYPFAWAETLGSMPNSYGAPRSLAVFHAYTGGVMPPGGSMIRIERTWWR
jgi:hypothetical protein